MDTTALLLICNAAGSLFGTGLALWFLNRNR